MSEAYVEAIVILTPKGDAAAARSWFEQHGFSVSRMAGGALHIAGPASLFTQTFQMTESYILQRGTEDVALPKPVDLPESVGSIIIRRTPSIHSE